MEQIDRKKLQQLIEGDSARLVEVLPAKAYVEEHLPGAINIPLKKLGDEAPRRLDPQRPVIVYCYDYQ
ncbi:MAG: rhodanese-like domain-containing protein [Actinomycetota bacterium]